MVPLGVGSHVRDLDFPTANKKKITYCNEIDIVIARAKVRVLRCITVVFKCMLAQVLRLGDGYMASTECAM